MTKRSGIGSSKLQTLIQLGAFALVAALALFVSSVTLSRDKASLQQLFDQQLISATNSGKAYLESRFVGMRNDLSMLVGIPSIPGYIRATSNGGIDPAHGESTEKWLQRMSTIFYALIRSHPDYLQIRFIGVADGGREIVRVDQRDGLTWRTPAADLQSKGHNEYFKETTKLGTGQYHASSVTLNREQGVIEMPARPMVRMSTPVRDPDGALIGIMVINASFVHWTNDLASQSQNNLNGYLVNANGDFLWHPDKKRTFGFELGHPYRLTQAFPNLTLNGLRGSSNALPVQALPNQRVSAIRVSMNPRDPSKYLMLLYEFPYSHIQPTLDAGRNSFLISVGLTAIAVMLFIAWAVRKAMQPLQQLTAAAQAMAKGDYDTPLPRVQGEELTALRSAFEAMKSAVAQRETELIQHRDNLEQLVQVATIEVEAIVSSAASGIVTVDENDVIRLVNPAAEQLFGWHASELVGQNVALLLTDAQVRTKDGSLQPLRLNMGSLSASSGCELRVQRKDGSPFDARLDLGHAEISPTRHFYVAFLTDITEQKEHEKELRVARDAAENAARAKSDFLANMSHEIRTPMNAILGLCYLLEQQDMTPLKRGMVKKIHGAGRSLLAIINDILDFSKIEAQRLDIENVPFRLSDVLENLASIMSSSVGDKQIDVMVSAPPQGAEFLKGDALRLGQVLINLAGNAIKFTETGEVAVKITQLTQPATPDKVHLRFAVCDTGIGIPEDKQESIFHAFSQADSTTTRSFGGTGLGLTISRRLVDLMGGTLSLRSEPGKGSEFFFELTFDVSEPLHNSAPQMLHQSILIADDQETARDMLSDTAASMGWQVEAVANGEKAVEAVERAGDKPYDVLLLDWRMPGLDGLETAQYMRARLDAMKQASIIIMATAFDREYVMKAVGADAVDVVLSKPVTSSSLYNAVLETKIRKGLLPGAVTTPASTKRLLGVQALVVDDSEINRDVAQRILEGEGAEITLAENGDIALALLHDREKRFDVVLMDIQMPVMDGYAATRQIRATPQLAHVPVIALTAGAFNIHRDAAFEAGMDAFVAKPFNVNELVEVVKRFATTTNEPLSAESSQMPKESDYVPQESVVQTYVDIDFLQGMALWRDEAIYKQSLRSFAREYQPSIDGIDALDSTEASRLAHKIKGTAGNLALLKVMREADHLEQVLRSNGHRTEASNLLQEAMGAALEAIHHYAGGESHALGAAADTSLLEFDGIKVTHLLNQTLAACHGDNPDSIEPLLHDLAAYLSTKQLMTVQQCVDGFDFRGAETAVQLLADSLDIVLEE